MRGAETPSQTAGPFFKRALMQAGMNTLAKPQTRGERITIEGCVLDGDRAPVSDALIEIWQADAGGCYEHGEDWQVKPIDPNFCGFGRAATDEHGRFRFQTIKPGPVASGDGALAAPHINVSIFARGLLVRLVTRIYFSDEPSNANDPVLKEVPPLRRATLIAKPLCDVAERRYGFDIILQGDDETVFFDV